MTRVVIVGGVITIGGPKINGDFFSISVIHLCVRVGTRRVAACDARLPGI